MADQRNPTQGLLFDIPAEVAPPPAPRQGRRRLRSPQRYQTEMRMLSLDQELPEDHPVRNVWAYVERLDLDGLIAQIQSVEGAAGAPAADPRVLLALWLYAFCRGVGSARELDRLCREHLAYRWLCGGVTTNYHALSDFRVGQEAFLDELLTHSAAVLSHAGLLTLERVAQDGMRTRGSAGSGSYRRETSLQEALAEAKEQLAALRQEAATDPGAGQRRRQAARERAARERVERLDQALAELQDIAARKHPAKKKPGESDEDYEKRTAPRASTTDPEARTMLRADGGYRPGYNINYATDTGTRAVLGVLVTNISSDRGLMAPMMDQLEERYGRVPREVVADSGYEKHSDIEELARRGITVYLPPQPRKRSDRYVRQPGESGAVGEWRERMGTAEAQEIYQERASTAEYVNAQARNQGLRRLTVRGLAKVRQMALWHAVAHNLTRAMKLGVSW